MTFRKTLDPEPANRTGLPDGLIERASTTLNQVYDFRRSDLENGEVVDEAFDGFEQVALVSEVETWLQQQIAIARLAIEANTGRAEFSGEEMRRNEEQLLDLVAAADLAGPTGEIDIGPALSLMFQWPTGAFNPPRSCPIEGGTLTKAMSNFGSDNESFGGRGGAARSRCTASAMVDLMLSEFIRSDSPSDLLEPATAAVTLISAFWWDRSPDAESVAVADAWTSLVDDVDGELTPEQLDTAGDILEQWGAYRDTLPEGFILCPLDPGWTP